MNLETCLGNLWLPHIILEMKLKNNFCQQSGWTSNIEDTQLKRMERLNVNAGTLIDLLQEILKS